MVYIVIYGLLALATACISIAPRTKSLWKVGLTFLFNWMITITIFSNTGIQYEAALTLGLDVLSACVCFIVYQIYQCRTCRYVMSVYIAQAGLYGYLLFSGESESYITHVALNALFILNALIIISSSIRRLISKDRRYHDIECFNRDRRINSRKRNQHFEGHYA